MTKAVVWLVERAGEVEEAGGQEKKEEERNWTSARSAKAINGLERW